MSRAESVDRDTEVFSCPSSTCEPGVRLIGIVGEDGKVGNLATSLVADEDFVEKTAADQNDGVPAERRFRFSGACAEEKCNQWTGSACGVVGRVMDHLVSQAVETNGAMPPCTIRADCRWYHQRGSEACGACVFVVTDNRVNEAVANG